MSLNHSFTGGRPRRPAIGRRALALAALFGLFALLAACASEEPTAASASPAQAAPSAPAPSPAIGDVLEAQTWLDHMQRDLIPFWTSAAALGQPVGNFPTVRTNDGSLAPDYTHRLPRMMGRQIYFYSVAYLMTGEPKLLEYAQAGVRWMIDHAWDKVHGGWYQSLFEDGRPRPGPMYTQDMAYAAQGLAAFYFVTRDPECELYLKKTHDLIFDPRYFWDPANKRVKDGMDANLSVEIDQERGGWELVAILDQINAYMLAVQPVLSQAADREQWGKDLVTLGSSLVREFWKDSIFWGQKDLVGAGGRHVDFGHTFKSYWMVYLIDQNLGSRLEAGIPGGIEPHIRGLMDLSYDPKYGIWAIAPTSPTEAVRGGSWWIHAESDQLAQTWNLKTKGSLTPMLKRTMEGWLKYFVDYRYGEVVSDIQANGKKASSNRPDGIGKVGDWKNGFHSAEHALLSYIHAQALKGEPVRLHFAAEKPEGFVTKPYLYPGRELSRSVGESFVVGGRTLVPISAELSVDLK